ncbi:MAG: DUF2510 domain-containing protein [Nitriliruptoraceae bacterium]
MGSPAAWHPDPTGNHEGRYWDGTHWTEHVANQGRVTSDPLDPLAALADPLQLQIERIDRQIHELQAERDVLSRALADVATPPVPSPEHGHGHDAAASPHTALDAGGPVPADPPPPSGNPVCDDAPPPTPPRSRRSGFAAFLATAGVFLLAAAALTFTAASWALMSTTAQFALLIGVTVATAYLSVRLDRRELIGVGAAVGVLAVVLAAVAIWGARRAGAPWPSSFTWPIAAFAATIVGATLARWSLRAVTTAAAISLLTAGSTLAVAIDTHVDLGVTGMSLLVTGFAVLIGATTRTWRTMLARRTIVVGALAGLTVAGLLAATAPADPSAGVPGAIGAALLATAVLVVAARWSVASVASIGLIATVTVMTLAHRFGPPAGLVDGPSPAVWLAAGIGLAAIAWSSLLLDRRRRIALGIGAVPTAIAVLAAMLLAVETTGIRVFTSLDGDAAALTDPWVAAGVALGAVALTAVIRRPSIVGGLTALVAITTAGALPSMAAWLLLIGVGIGMRVVATRTRASAFVPLGLGIAAIGFVAADGSLLPIVTITAALLGAWVTVSSDDAPRTIAASYTVLGVALVVATPRAALQVDRAQLLTVALVTGLAGAAIAARWRDDPFPTSSIVALTVLTMTVPTFASGQRAAGLLVILAGMGWLVLALQGDRLAAWIAAAVASIGSVVVLDDVGIETIEAYTVGPAILFAIVGIMWLMRDDAVGSVPALLPALTIALVPSLVVLANDPRVVARLVGLTIAAGALALVGVIGRLTAPTGAAVIVAIWVALSQVGIVLRTVNPLILFVVVGTLLVWLGAGLERQRRRARQLVRHLSQFR